MRIRVISVGLSRLMLRILCVWLRSLRMILLSCYEWDGEVLRIIFRMRLFFWSSVFVCKRVSWLFLKRILRVS